MSGPGRSTDGGRSSAGKRLRGWKEIATWAGVDERTVKRWEGSRGLPVHRVPGEARAPVYAFEAELLAWLRVADESADPEPLPGVREAGAPPADASSPATRLWLLAASALVVLALLMGGLLWLRLPGPLPPPQLPATPAGRAAWADGEYALSTRTRDGILLANRRFSALVAAEPGFAPGLARLAVSYNLLAQYDLMPAGQAYARAVALADRALERDPELPLALAARGFARFYGARDIPGAMADLRAAAARPDATAEAHQWLALISMHSGRQQLALTAIARAEALDPKSRAIKANHGLILMHAGRLAEAEALLKRLASLDPGMAAPTLHLASLYLATGRGDDHAAMLERLAETRRNPVLRLRARALREAFASGGMPALLQVRRAQLAADGEPFALAGAEAMLGHHDAAFALLERARARDDPHMVGLLVDLPLASLHRDPRFAALAARAGYTPRAVAVLAGGN